MIGRVEIAVREASAWGERGQAQKKPRNSNHHPHNRGGGGDGVSASQREAKGVCLEGRTESAVQE